MRRFILAVRRLIVLALVLMVPGAASITRSGDREGLHRAATRCSLLYDQWHASSHRGVACEKCHGGALTLDASFHWNNATARLFAPPRRPAGANRDSATGTCRP